MTNIFDVRPFNNDEINALRIIVTDTIETMKQIDDLNSHMSDNIKGLCERLNNEVGNPDAKVKPSLIKKMAKAKIKEDLDEQKNAVSEIETGLSVVFKI